MRYEYTVTKEGGEAEIMKAMSWKILFKSLLLKYPKFSGWCTYINKKGHVQTRNFNQGREIINKHDFKDSELKLQKGQKTGYMYGQLSNTTVNQVVTDIQADKFPQFNNPNLYKPPTTSFPAPPYSNKEEESPFTVEERKAVQDLLRKLKE